MQNLIIFFATMCHLLILALASGEARLNGRTIVEEFRQRPSGVIPLVSMALFFILQFLGLSTMAILVLVFGLVVVLMYRYLAKPLGLDVFLVGLDEE